MSNKNSQPPTLNLTPVMSSPPRLNTITSKPTPRDCMAGMLMETKPKTRMAFDSLPKDLEKNSD